MTCFYRLFINHFWYFLINVNINSIKDQKKFETFGHILGLDKLR